MIGSLIGVLIIAGLACGLYFLLNNSPNKSKVELPPHLSPVQQAQYLADHNNYEAAEQYWQKLIKKTNSEQTNMDIYFSQFSVALQYKQYSDAKKYINEELSLDKDSSTPYVSLAYLAQAMGNKSQAISYWQQALKYLNTSQPGYNLIEEQYKSNIAALK